MWEPLGAVAGAFVAKLVEFGMDAVRDRGRTGDIKTEKRARGELYPSTCGDQGINLDQQRLLVSMAFGSYFAGLLERGNSYIGLAGQIQCPAIGGLDALDPIQRLFWSFHDPKGPRLLVIAAEGGMGKSTLAAKIVRCLYERRAFDKILGDSAKKYLVNPVTGQISTAQQSIYDLSTFYTTLCNQLSVRAQGETRARIAIISRLEGRRALIIVDNLETLSERDKMAAFLRGILSRDVRAIVTTRQINVVNIVGEDTLVVNLKPLTDTAVVRNFLLWHIARYQASCPELGSVVNALDDRKRIGNLIERTGGIPLLMQLVLSDIARKAEAWDYLRDLPILFGDELLVFLYKSRWEELGRLGEAGELARCVLKYVSMEQYKGRRVTFEHLVQMSCDKGNRLSLEPSLRLLDERFLILNGDHKRGDYSVFPSLAQYVQYVSATE